MENKNILVGNKIYIYGNFNEDMINMIVKLDALIKEEAEKSDGRIIFEINSDGGQTSYLWILLSKIKFAKSLDIIIETNVYAGAYSCGSILACAGTVGYRNVSKYAEYGCHYGGSVNDAGTPKQLIRQIKVSNFHFNNIKEAYLEFAKIKNLDEILSDDCFVFCGGDEIISNGLADNLI